MKMNEHTHSASAASVQVAKVKANLKRRAEESQEVPSVLIYECIADVPSSVQESLPTLSSMKKIIRRKRNDISLAPANPTDLQQLEIPIAYKMYKPDNLAEENFFLADSGQGSNRIIIFGRESWKHYLVESTWFVDGTFNVARILFSQVFCILAKKFDGVQPILHILLTNTQRSTYVRMFEMVKSLVPNVRPQCIHCDFEQAAIGAMRKCFPGVKIRGCFFHLAQSMHRHIAAVGASRQYNTEPDFALKAKMILALTFVPHRDLGIYTEALADFLPQELLPILDWFEFTYIGIYTRRGSYRRAPLFPHDMWSQYETTLNDEDRTNNHAELLLNSELTTQPYGNS
ncbi:uncharacterized protein LOC135203434 [Macrobrachium nipponense]|uniref:uncharacterized protein LOC135203434 n=1 Tax=Macrobrachium nipponense TaxID=159736 RepID=UPI0030C8199A